MVSRLDSYGIAMRVVAGTRHGHYTNTMQCFSLPWEGWEGRLKVIFVAALSFSAKIADISKKICNFVTQ